MMQDEWEEVLRFYRKAGLERSPESIEPEDHLGIELECLARLSQRFAEAFEQGDEEACTEALRMQLHMLEEHLLLWVPRFTKKVLEISNTEFYRSLATITCEHLLMDTEFVKDVLGITDQA